MGEDFERMGPEGIRARMDLNKVWINGWLGVMFSLFLGYVFIIAKNLDKHVGPSEKIALSETILFLTLIGVGVLILISIIGFGMVVPLKKRFLDLAKELDKLKKKE